MTIPTYTANGKTKTLKEWGEELGVKKQTLWARLKYGMPADVALSHGFEKAKKPRDYSKLIEKECEFCGEKFVIPKCRDWREKCCSSVCKKMLRKRASEVLMQSRTKMCIKCGKAFVAKKSQIDAGQGEFCSIRCCFFGRNKYLMHSPESRRKAAKRFADGILSGRIKIKCGSDSPMWKGGYESTKKRRVESGKAAAQLRNYRDKNPEKVKEWSRRRRGEMVGRLPRGTVKRIGSFQKWKCVICNADIKGKYHIDHIMPLKLGGEHSYLNIQLLCPTCNLKKSAKHPVDYMQERGFLL